MPLMPNSNQSVTIITGSANPALAQAIAQQLGTELGGCALERYPDGEVSVEIGSSVRGQCVFLVQQTSPPVNDNLLELLALADACRRDGAARITAIVPFLGYGRADKRQNRREPIMARVIADFMEIVGIGQMITVDLHAPQAEGFFRIAVDTLTAVPTLCGALRGRISADLTIVPPDVGRVEVATQYAEQCLGAPIVVVHKQRVSGSETKVSRVVGDVSRRVCLIVDDMISTGGTIAETVAALLAAGARPEMMVAATHGVFTGPAREKLSHPTISAIFVTDSVAVVEDDWPQLHVVSIAPVIAAAMRRLANDDLPSSPCRPHGGKT
jgi:ribose-phosphate pyrophosphokinase